MWLESFILGFFANAVDKERKYKYDSWSEKMSKESAILKEAFLEAIDLELEDKLVQGIKKANSEQDLKRWHLEHKKRYNSKKDEILGSDEPYNMIWERIEQHKIDEAQPQYNKDLWDSVGTSRLPLGGKNITEETIQPTLSLLMNTYGKLSIADAVTAFNLSDIERTTWRPWSEYKVQNEYRREAISYAEKKYPLTHGGHPYPLPANVINPYNNKYFPYAPMPLPPDPYASQIVKNIIVKNQIQIIVTESSGIPSDELLENKNNNEGLLCVGGIGFVIMIIGLLRSITSGSFILLGVGAILFGIFIILVFAQTSIEYSNATKNLKIIKFPLDKNNKRIIISKTPPE